MKNATLKFNHLLPTKFLAKRVSGRPMDTHFRKKYKEFIHLISYNFMAKHAFWTASSNVWLKAWKTGNGFIALLV